MRYFRRTLLRTGCVLAVSCLLATSAAAQTQPPTVASTPARPGSATEAQYYQPSTAETPAFWPQNGATHAAHVSGCPQQSEQVYTQGTQEPEQGTDVNQLAAEKTRKLSRTFAVSAGKPYALDTRYGRVLVNVWSRPEIRTDVDIITRADTDEKAQQLQEMIQVELTETDPATGGVSVRSKFGAMPHGCRSRTKLYEVNYTVWIPRNTPLRVYNTFGEVSILGDLAGPTELAVEYGTLRTGRLEGSKNLLRIGNGQASVPYVRQAGIDASYSRLRLDAGQVVDLRNNYSDINIGVVQDLSVHSKYGDVALGTVRNLRGTSGFSTFSIDKLGNQLDMTVQYCPNFEVRNTGRNFRAINLDGGYSTILLNFADEAGFNFDVNTQHGKLLVDKKLVRVASEESSPVSSDMQGTFGVAKARPASSNVNIKVRYGNVRFNR
ncbi:hypothetical protein J0X19_04635 [Hymenobacter sp. BT186]|uniref:Adhesin domain-containing protein n=1 Tax=Hymenobacter telluris TaxID=2816474 RepID=A0A939JBE6_9BACT|nr:hypothetical protein [Hymenobacter telluris]MBO0357220.1 hypothetical protein [Hymenobacter telluris]MBW3373246.1 hypothetical protein [Hymenobacter norwichensis]